MNNLPIPDLSVLKTWLMQLSIEFYECDSCQALHLPHMQSINGIFDAKIDWLDEDIIVFSAATEVRPTGLLPLVASLSEINAQFSLVNGFVDVQDDNLPKLIISHALTAGAGLTKAQFQRFIVQTEQQIALFVESVKLKGFLFFPEEDEFSEQDKVLH